jgi:putative AdoMet-dependent methyltransferase
MDKWNKWQYDEMKQVGTDYSNQSEVEFYDEKMQKLRDIKEETENIIEELGIDSDHTVLEIGIGTGEFALSAANFCKKVIALDVSSTMLEYAKKKAAKRGISNLEFHHAGFLTYEHNGTSVDAVVSQLALHHLPDFWKLIALKRIFSIMQNHGRFFLKDIVYSFDVENYREFFTDWVSGIHKVAGTELAQDLQFAIRDEYSTLDWIMEEIRFFRNLRYTYLDYNSVK